MKGYIAYLILVTAIAFANVANMFMRGRLTATLQHALSLLLFGLMGLSFFVFNWKLGLVTLAIGLLLIRVLKPVAGRLVHRMLGYRTGVSPFLEPGAGLQDALGSIESWERYEKTRRIEKDKRLSQWNILLRRSNYATLVKKYGLTPETIDDHWMFLGACALGDLAWDIIQNPAKLEKSLQMRAANRPEAEIMSEFKEYR
jgi:hypothetical protein